MLGVLRNIFWQEQVLSHDELRKLLAEGLAAHALDLSPHLSLSPVSIRELSALFAASPRDAHVVSLSLAQLVQLGDDDVCLLLAALPGGDKVEALSLANVYDLSARVVLAAIAALPKLKRLQLAGLTLLRDADVRGVVQAYKGTLEELDISGLVMLSDAVFAEGIVAEKIKVLDITGCSQISCDGLKGMPGMFPNVEVLKLAGLREIEDSSLEATLGKLLKLREVDLSGCRRLEEASVDRLRRTFKSVNFISADMDEMNPADVEKAKRSLLKLLFGYFLVMLSVFFASDLEYALWLNFVFIGLLIGYIVVGLVFLVLGSGM